MKTIYFLIFIAIIATSFGQNPPEQIAFDYFFEEIFTNEMNKRTKKIIFNGKSLGYTSGSVFGIDCIEEDKSFYLVENGFKEATSKISINDKFTKQFNKSRNSDRKIRSKLYIYNVFNFPNSNYSVILLLLKNLNTSGEARFHIVIENDQVINWCVRHTI